MLSIGKLGAGQERYYLDKVAEGVEDYYSGEGEAEGYWLGDGAEFLGLEGKVEGEELIFMLTARNPASGDPLGLKSAPNREPVPGFDLTFSAPKSVSLTWALGGSPVGGQVAEAHHAAVREAVSYLERNACWARRGKDGREFLPGTGFIGAGYVHRSSRAGDPQLHTHVLIANATYGPDGRWSRLYHPALYEHAKAAGHVYEAHLRHELTRRLGVEWQPVRNGIADIRGFDQEELAQFSTRRAGILEAAGGEGASARAMQVATLATRQAKQRDLTDASLRETWRVKGEEVWLTRKAIAHRLGHERPGETVLSARQVERTVTAHASHFDRRGAIEAVADNLPHGAPAAEVVRLADAFLASEQVIEIAASPRGATYTTQRIWDLERKALAAAERMASASDRALAGEIVAGRVIDARPSLKPDQREMVRRLLCDGEGLVVVIGEAGTGKTYAVSAAVSGWAAQATSLQAAAPTWRAANVLRAEGIAATTVAGLLARLDAAAEYDGKALEPGSVLLVDEAGMVDSASLARLIDHAQQADAKLVLIGDPAQLGEIEAGGLFAAIADRSEPVVLDEVIRHHYELDREGAKQIREGQGAEALGAYQANERVTVGADREELREAMVRDWVESHGRGEDALMIAKRNADVRELNVKAREALKAEGRLRGEEIEVAGQRFAKGDQVITRVNDHRAQIYNRERWEVVEVDPRAHAVVLAGIDTARRVGVDAGYLRSVNPRDGGPALEHGYAATTYQAQGATVDRAYVMADSSMTRQEFYVAASRSREETYFYATPEVNLAREEIAPASQREGLAHIAEAAERDGAQVAAHDKALRARLGPLSTAELEARRAELRSEAGAERANEEAREQIAERIAEARGRLDRIPERAEAARNLPRRQRRPELERLDAQAEREAATIQRGRAELREMPAVAHDARAEAATADYLIAQREQAARVALRTSPPDYITKELGERPARDGKAMAWDEAAERIERYRKREGIEDRDTALGRRPEHDRDKRDDWDAQRERLTRAQEQLGLRRALERERSLDHGWDLER
jgi:conjugative relaxase-like TrwC/TraI family protein